MTTTEPTIDERIDALEANLADIKQMLRHAVETLKSLPPAKGVQRMDTPI